MEGVPTEVMAAAPPLRLNTWENVPHLQMAFSLRNGSITGSLQVQYSQSEQLRASLDPITKISLAQGESAQSNNTKQSTCLRLSLHSLELSVTEQR